MQALSGLVVSNGGIDVLTLVVYYEPPSHALCTGPQVHLLARNTAVGQVPRAQNSSASSTCLGLGPGRIESDWPSTGRMNQANAFTRGATAFVSALPLMMLHHCTSLCIPRYFFFHAGTALTRKTEKDRSDNMI